MSTPDEVGLDIAALVEGLVNKGAYKATGVEPQVINGFSIGEDGRILHAETVTSSGGSVIVAAARKSAAQNAVDSVINTVNFNSVVSEYDPLGTITTGASWRFTSQELAYYTFDVQLSLAIMGGATWGTSNLAELYLETTPATRLLDDWRGIAIANNGRLWLRGKRGATLDIGDQAYVTVFQDCGTDLSINVSSAQIIITKA